MELLPPEAAEHPQEQPPEYLSEAERAKARHDNETVELGRTFVLDAEKANAFPKLSRYEAEIERSLYRALHELQRLQAARGTKDHAAPPPQAVHVDVSGIHRDEL